MSPTWPIRRKAPAAEALLSKLQAHGWKNDAERDELLRSISALSDVAPEDLAWMAVESDPAVRQAGLGLLKRLPWEASSPALFGYLSSKTEAVRRLAMVALEAVAGGAFFERLPDLLSHNDPAVVHAALDHLKRNPNERALPWIARAMTSPSSAVRRRAFSIIEAAPSAKSAQIAVAALDSDDEELRFKAIQLIQKFPDEAFIPALLKRCRNDSTRVQDAAIAAIGPMLAASQKPYTEEVLPLFADSNPKVRQLASRIAATQPPARIAEAFLHTFKATFGPPRDRAVEALAALGPQFLKAFLERAETGDAAEEGLAASIAVTIRTPEAVGPCVRYLTGDDWWLRERAAMALAEIRDESTLPHLLQLLRDPESNLSAAAAIGAWGTPKGLAGLLDAYKQPDSSRDLRLEILDAFVKIVDPRVPGLLQKIGQIDPDPLIREKAARLAKVKLGGPDAGDAEGAPRTFEPVDFGATPRPSLPELLRHARAVDASDLHLAVGVAPQLRIHGRLGPLPLPRTPEEQMDQWLASLLTPELQRELVSRRQLDFCYKDADLGRFRTNVFHQRLGKSAVMRIVPYEIPNLRDIGLPESLWEITGYSQGLILVTGAASCGKTTTLAALLDRINETERGHIITVEDPIEYVHANKESLINQREIPSHSKSFAKALRQSLREDPDVILVGEMRDLETISLAITASETGHLVLATLHTTTAPATVDRIINAFPPDQQGQIRMMVSDSLKAVVSQTLLPRRDGRGRVAAFEILRNTPAVGGLIRDGKTFQIPTAIQTGGAAGMQLMDSALLRLVQDGTIDPRAGYDRAQRKEPFEPFLEEAAS
ncbi:MAG TPA: PilT/PilU family type 4a pilus ATPase [Thermoanaerobaculia bacterium]|nr:PilT/PilU family type 4a pilus ATPase [Thermoanaerobaculia bacterium]